MPGTWFYSLCLFMTIGIEAAPARVHEIQLRGNDYAAALDPRSLQASAIAKVILRVFSDDEKNGGLYFANRSFKAVRPVLDDWAPRFHAGAVELWAWMGARYFSWIADARLLDSEWRDGRKRVIPKLDLFNPDAERVIVGLFRQLAQKAVPGILIQDDLVLRRGEGFSNWGKAYFTRATGWPADEMAMARNDSAMGRAWERCKSERIGQLLEKIVQACKGTDPRITVAMNVHYELPLEPAQARSWYAHDRDILAASALDYFYLMAYHRQIKDELALGEAANRLYFANMTTAALEFFGPRLVVKMQVRDWRSGVLIPLDELRAYYDLIPAGALRVCFAAVDPGDIPLVSQVFADRSPGPQRAKK